MKCVMILTLVILFVDDSDEDSGDKPYSWASHTMYVDDNDSEPEEPENVSVHVI